MHRRRENGRRAGQIMNAAALAFRFRVFIFVLLYLLGFLPSLGLSQRQPRHTLARGIDAGWPAAAGSAWRPQPGGDAR